MKLKTIKSIPVDSPKRTVYLTQELVNISRMSTVDLARRLKKFDIEPTRHTRTTSGMTRPLWGRDAYENVLQWRKELDAKKAAIEQIETQGVSPAPAPAVQPTPAPAPTQDQYVQVDLTPFIAATNVRMQTIYNRLGTIEKLMRKLVSDLGGLDVVNTLGTTFDDDAAERTKANGAGHTHG